MGFTPRRAAIVVALALLATVATQLFYVAAVAPTDDALLRKITWITEVSLYSLIAVAGLALVARGAMPMVWAAIAIAGMVNVIQLGIGLAQFGPAGDAGDPKVFAAVLAGAFFLYFHAKAMIGLAAIGVGLTAWAEGNGVARALGAASLLAGIAAAVLNLLGMANGMDMVFPAGGAGTAAAGLLALTVIVNRREA